MKYGQQLETESVPEWSLHNIDYNTLKEFIKIHTTRDQATAIPIPGQQDTSLQRFELNFYDELYRQHDRVGLFVTTKADEINRRLPRGATTFKRQRRLAKYERTAAQLSDETRDLARFSNAQVVAFRKILKKYRKWTGSSSLGTRFRENVLSDPKSFTKRDFSHLQSQCDELLNTIRATTPLTSSPTSNSRPPTPSRQHRRSSQVHSSSSSTLQALSSSVGSEQIHIPRGPKTLTTAPVQTHYWNEYDDGSESGEVGGAGSGGYAIYLHPDDESEFPGVATLVSFFTVPIEKAKKWMNARGAAVAHLPDNGSEHSPLLSHSGVNYGAGSTLYADESASQRRLRRQNGKTPGRAGMAAMGSGHYDDVSHYGDDDDGEDGDSAGEEGEDDMFASEHEFPQGYETYYATLPSVADQRMARYRETILLRGAFGCFAAAAVLLAVTGILISTGRHRLRVEVDAGVIMGVVASLGFACAALGMVMAKSERTTLATGLLVWTTFGAICVLNGVVLLFVMGNTVRATGDVMIGSPNYATIAQRTLTMASASRQPREMPRSLSSLALLVAAAALALAVAYFRDSVNFGTSLQSAASAPQTYCYEGIKTLAEDQPSARCFSVVDGHFTEVFTPENELDSPSLSGYVIPGLWDGHGHLIQYGEFLQSVDLFGSTAAKDIRKRLLDYIGTHQGIGSKDQWLRGFGWDQMAMGGMPTAALLESDEKLKGLYVMLDRIDGHCIWVSQAVLDLLPAQIPDVPGGEIIRDPGMGVFCDNAMDLIMSLWPRPGREVKATYIRTAMQKLSSLGLVGMHDAGVIPEDLQLYRELADTEGWTIRVNAMIECKERNTFCPNEAVGLRQTTSEFLTIHGVKLFADGALGSWGSAMIDPYSDRPDMSGSLLVNGSTLLSLTRDWSEAGFQVNIHAIGDLANRYAIDALETALVDLCPSRPPAECQHEHRFRIEHAQIIHPHDQARLHSLALIPSIQPTHATSDMKYAELRLGSKRTREEAYRMKTLLRNRPILGSDFPIEPPDPFQGIYAAVVRRSPHTGKNADGTNDPWYPDEALTLDEALLGFTQGPAYGAFLEELAGVIQVGAFADWVVLDKPISSFDLEDFRDMKVRETWVGGKLSYKRE
ncbi:metal-dependent amidohydrolase [Grosmannia clavigera kw1407]|uniref:Metal-dependent amidohydrolase n=1 Tax=Grosmannia clavigera (strain kw1407 / UAMH 11150) TaxID=655863 RepID=F0XI11_GROCL|nr:metal-dependent amidohydrolase [Grosmannia clavigera kw1407]EFX03200.1 metal-dependent amidohydrolase [Grosmannia clavigera kw1407]